MPQSIALGSSRTPIWFLCAAPWFSSTLFGSWDTCVHAATLERCRDAGRASVMKSEEYFRPAAECMSPAVENPDARTQAAILSACSGSLEGLQFGAAFLAEGTQRI